MKKTGRSPPPKIRQGAISYLLSIIYYLTSVFPVPAAQTTNPTSLRMRGLILSLLFIVLRLCEYILIIERTSLDKLGVNEMCSELLKNCGRV